MQTKAAASGKKQEQTRSARLDVPFEEWDQQMREDEHRSLECKRKAYALPLPETLFNGVAHDPISVH